MQLLPRLAPKPWSYSMQSSKKLCRLLQHQLQVIITTQSPRICARNCVLKSERLQRRAV